MSAVKTMEKIARVSPEDLNDLLESPEVVIIDVRKKTDWEASEEMIEGAVAEDPAHPEKWMAQFPRDRTFVLYCASQDEATSTQVAQIMEGQGFREVSVLEGGWPEWERKGYPTVPK